MAVYSHNPNDLTPVMTANNAPSPNVASASSEYAPAYYAFDHGFVNKWVANGVQTGWIKFDFGADNTKTVVKYTLTGENVGSVLNRSPKTWTLEGSNDNANWTVLDTQTDVSVWTAAEMRTYEFTNSIAYRYYKLNITASQGSAYLTVAELEFIGDIDMYTTWNPSDKSSSIVLSGGDLIATGTGGGIYAGVRSIIGVSSGKWYWEITVGAVAWTLDIGIADAGVNLDVMIGASPDGYAYRSSGSKVNNNSWPAYGDSYTTGDVISVALDMDSGKVWWAKNGVWQASGDPANGTNEAFSGISGTFYAVVNCQYTPTIITANFGAPAFSHSVPSGFNSGLYTLPGVYFTFTNPTPAHLSTVYGTIEQLQLTTTVSGSESSYTYDASFYDNSDVQIGSTISGVNSGSSAASSVYLATPSGINYSWYVVATSSGSDDTSSTYTFSNRFLYEGYVKEGVTPINRQIYLHNRDSGELVGSTTSSGANGYFYLETTYNGIGYIVCLDDDAGSDYNDLIYGNIYPATILG